mmetsp:Transcript_18929/g.18073  ORF Transcript_18929/g.18073 Transcript_18929/m.18073 type:complete len:103 (-) Transcript_18929:409-717(-)
MTKFKLLQQINNRHNIQTSQAKTRQQANYFSVCCSPEYSRFSHKSIPLRQQEIFGRKKREKVNFILGKNLSEQNFAQRKERASQIKQDCEGYMGILPDQGVE